MCRLLCLIIAQTIVPVFLLVNQLYAQATFTCDNTFHQTVKDPGGDYHFYEIETDPVSFTFKANLAMLPQGTGINALAYNPDDRYIYGVSAENTTNHYHLYRIDAAYNVTDLGAITGIAAAEGNVLGGCMDENGTYYVSMHDFAATNGGEIYEIDVTTLIATKRLQFNDYITDMAIDPISGDIYGVDLIEYLNYAAGDPYPTKLKRIDVSAWTVTQVGASQTDYGSVASVFFNSKGDLYGYAVDRSTTNTGAETLVKIDKTNATYTSLGSSTNSTHSDGCSCAYGFEMDKAASATSYEAGDVIVYTISIYNQSGSAATNVTFNDPLNNGLTYASEPYDLSGLILGATSISNTGIANFTITNLPTGTSSFKVNVRIPTLYTGPNPYPNMATLSSLPAGHVSVLESDDPDTDAIDDSTKVCIENKSLAYSSVSFCISGSDASPTLVGVTGGTYSAGAGLDINASTGVIDVSESTPSTYTVTYTVGGSCPTAVQTTVKIDADVSSGTATNQDICITNNAFNLNSTLSGATGGGTWNDDDATGGLSGSTFDATTAGLSAGSSYEFTYTVTNGACTDSETVTITLDPTVSAGTATDQDICITNNAFNLAPTISGATAGGSWNDDDATGGLSGSTFDATTAGLSAGSSYDFTYSVDGGACPDDSETVTITLDPTVTAGTATDQDICITNSTFNLATTISGATAGGSWNDDDATGGLSGSTFDATTAGLSAGSSYDFTYTVDGDACPDDSETVTITLDPTVTAGTATDQDICITNGSFNLATTISGATAGGSWNDDDATGGLSGSTFDATTAGLSAGSSYDFTYTVDGDACPDDSETVTITLDPTVTAGTATDQDICVTNNAFNLATTISGATAGGSWNDDDATGGLTGSTFDATTAGLSAGSSYDFTYSVDGGACPDDSETVTITLDPTVTAGTATDQDICITNSSFNLTTTLSGATAGGSWNDDDATGGLTGSTFDATTAGLSAGNSYDFTYTVDGDACPDDSETVTITLDPTVTAGTATDEDICITNNAFNLATTISGATAGGSWNDDDATGGLSGATFDATTAGLSAGSSYDFTYTVDGDACPDDSETVTITLDPTVTAGTATDQDICITNSSFNLATTLSGATAGGSWNDDDATGGLTGSTFDATTAGLSAGNSYDFTYSVDGGACPDDSETVTITLDPTVTAGTATDRDICITNSAFNLATTISGATAGGTWSDDDATGGLTGSTFDATTAGLSAGSSYDFTYTVDGDACPDDSETVTITLDPTVTAGTATDQDICITNATFDLNSTLSGATAGGSWNDDDATGGLSGSTFDATTAGLSAGSSYDFTYTVDGDACPDDSETVTITLDPTVTAGTATDQDICITNNAFNLATTISGATAGGSWSDDDATGGLTGSTFDATTAGLSAGNSYDFTYSVDGGACPNDSETVTITLDPTVTAGTATDQDICITNSSFNLATTISGATAGGTWSDDDATGGLSGSVFDATTAGLSAGSSYDFTYTVDGDACPDDSETVTITLDPTVTAGTATNQDICITDATFDLNTTLSGATVGGVWSDDDATGGLSGSTFDATTAGLSAGNSYEFTYSVDGDACPDDSESVTITLDPTVTAGSGNNTTICITNATFNLNTTLSGATAGGAWSDDDATGGLSGSILDATVAGVAANNSYQFTYTVDGDACPNDDETVTISIDPTVTAGTATDQNICITENAFDLSTTLTGPTAGGIWNDNDATGGLSGSVFDATVAGLAAGSGYDFTYSVDGGACPDDSETVTITLDPTVTAGTATDQDICITNAVFDLGTTLSGATTGGTWNDDDATGGLSGSTFDATTGLTAGATYDFTYSVDGGACPDDSETVRITLDSTITAGTATDQDICITETTFDLSSAVAGETEGGTWSDDDATGGLTGSIFDATVAGLTAGSTYAFTYSVDGDACPDDSETLNITLDPTVTAGTGSTQNVCISETALDLNTLLIGETPGGTWSDDDATGELSGNVFDASAVATGSYDFTYSVEGDACPDDTESVTVNVVNNVTAGTSKDSTICETVTDFDLFATLSNNDAGGSWSDLDGTGALSGATFNASMVPANGSYRFRYHIGGGACESDSVEVTIFTDSTVTAGVASNTTICENNISYNLNNRLTGADAHGLWFDDESTGALSGTQNKLFNALMAGANPVDGYDFTYTVEGGTCPDASTTVNIKVDSTVVAGSTLDSTICETEELFNLNSTLIGADAFGVWQDEDGTGALDGVQNELFDASLVGANPLAGYEFIYELEGGTCPNASVSVHIFVDSLAEAGTATHQIICETSTSLNLNSTLTGADPTGTWSDDDASGGLTGSIFNASTAGPNPVSGYNFTYAIDGGECSAASVLVNVKVDSTVTAGTGEDQVLCETSTSYDLNTALTGADAIGSWSDVSGSGALSGSQNNQFDASAAGANPTGGYNFTYTVDGGSCPDANETVNIKVDSTVVAGVSQDQVLCETVAAIDLNATLTGADAIGSWQDADGTGALSGPQNNVFGPNQAGANPVTGYNFTYFISGGECPDASVSVNVKVDSTVEAGSATDQVICETENAFNLSTTLAGTDFIGIWKDVDGTGSLSGFQNSSFDAQSAGANPVGGYQFTYWIAGGTCPDDSVTVVVQVDSTVEAGTTTNQRICELDSLDLTNTLSGADATGSWSSINASGALQSSLFVAGLAGANPVDGYDFQYAIDGGTCPDDDVTVQVFVDSTVAAGTAVDALICESEVLDLFSTLSGHDLIGTWSDDTPSGAMTGSTFNAATAGASPVSGYDFTYFIAGGTCPDVSVGVNVKVDSLVSAGIGTDQVICETDSAFDLNTALSGADLSLGTWTEASATGALTSTIFDGTAVQGDSTYAFTFIVDGGVCPGDTTGINVTVAEIVHAGHASGVAYEICDNITDFNLFDLLDGTQDAGGTWSDDNGSGALYQDSLFDASAATLGGVYAFTYTVNAVAPCSDSTATVLINVLETPFAGDSAGTDTLCNVGDPSIDLNTLVVNGQLSNVTWSVVSSPANLVNGTFDSNTGVFNPAGNEPGIYSFSKVVDNCGQLDELQISVVVEEGRDSDGDGMNDAFEGKYETPVTDTDGDGIANYLDLDSDNDGIQDGIEAGPQNDPCASVAQDTDGDGVADHLDLDSDGDGIFDLEEGGLADSDMDENNDGTIDEDVEVGSNGLADDLEDGTDSGVSNEELADSDEDGVEDYLDLDSDNDGLSDITETGNGSLDTDGDGVLDDMTDNDGDGLSDVLDEDIEFGDKDGNTAGDQDGDGLADHADLDSDNDGIQDIVEAGGEDADGDGKVDNYQDADGDGLADDGSSLVQDPTDTDEDGIADHLDLDSDNDGTTDLAEGGGVDVNEDGMIDDFVDNNNDGVDDNPDNVVTDPVDTDGDGLADVVDLDSDNDGIPDLVETGGEDADEDGEVDDFVDADGDGLTDDEDDVVTNPWDTDGDGNADYADLDSDNDGLSDVQETGGTDEDNDGQVDDFVDADGDGLTDNTDDVIFDPVDTDGDGNTDHADLDSDNDGMTDIEESGNGNLDENNDGKIDQVVDSNGDGMDDNQMIEDPIDTDGDGTEDHLDSDSDNDGISDVVESGNGYLDQDGDGVIEDNESGSTNDGLIQDVDYDGSKDTDGDGVSDHVDLDSDNDGIPDDVESGSDDANGIEDTDGDGIWDYVDLDSDNDGISDLSETHEDAADLDENIDGILDDTQDSDGDGIVDIIDGTDDGFGGGLSTSDLLELSDPDGDGDPNYVDDDSDGDDLSDISEIGLEHLDGDGDGMIDDDSDLDGDGVADVIDGNDLGFGGVDGEVKDIDGDGTTDQLDTDIDDVVIPAGFSPNGDGVNDFLVIHNMGPFDDNTLMIFNRWGNLIYKSHAYQNDWNGTYNRHAVNLNSSDGQQVPAGTYYYIFIQGETVRVAGKYADMPDKVKTGYVYISY